MDAGVQVSLKRAAAERAADYIGNGMAVGLGTGSTARYVAEEISARLRNGRLRDIACAPTSERTRALAETLGIQLTTLENNPVLDIAIDGADEVDPHLDMIKGAGGALLREKIVGQAARQYIIAVDESKLVTQLGKKTPIPIEVVKFGWRTQIPAIEALGGKPTLRVTDSGEPYVTDEGNVILDTTFDQAFDPAALLTAVRSRPGVAEVGLFLGMANLVVVGKRAGVEVLSK
jgi:ribose 5-phosphate isomerase A